MAIALTDDSDALIRLLADRIEVIERTLDEDEYFCNGEIDGLYRAALRYVQSIEDKFKHRCRALKSKLDQCRQENARLSKRNKQEFESSIERVEHLVTRGQQREALEQFHQYEEQFQQRRTLIEKLPKLSMQDIDINEYFSFDQQLDTPLHGHPSTQGTKNRTLKKAMDFSLTMRGENPNQSTDSMKSGQGDALTSRHVCHYQYECNQLLLMAGSSQYILLCKNRLPELDRCSLTIIKRFNRKEHQIPWQDNFIVSLGFASEQQFFVFTQYQLFLYSVGSLAKLYSFSLFKAHYTSSTSDDLQCCLTGTVRDKRAFYIHSNGQSHRVLSVLDCETWDPIRHFNLTEMFPDVQQFVHLAMTEDSIQFLVELNGSQHAVQVCSLDRSLSMRWERMIRLSHADKPSQICSVYLPKFRKHLLVVNDRSAKVIHLLSREKYLRSYPWIAHALCYVEDNHELVLASNVDICSISLHANDNLFSKLSSEDTV